MDNHGKEVTYPNTVGTHHLDNEELMVP